MAFGTRSWKIENGAGSLRIFDFKDQPKQMESQLRFLDQTIVLRGFGLLKLVFEKLRRAFLLVLVVLAKARLKVFVARIRPLLLRR